MFIHFLHSFQANRTLYSTSLDVLEEEYFYSTKGLKSLFDADPYKHLCIQRLIEVLIHILWWDNDDVRVMLVWQQLHDCRVSFAANESDVFLDIFFIDGSWFWFLLDWFWILFKFAEVEQKLFWWLLEAKSSQWLLVHLIWTLRWCDWQGSCKRRLSRLHDLLVSAKLVKVDNAKCIEFVETKCLNLFANW